MKRLLFAFIMLALLAQGVGAEFNFGTDGDRKISISLIFHEMGKIDVILPDVQVTAFDGIGNIINEITDANGYVALEGVPGTWRFSASKGGYKTNIWDMPIESSNNTPKQAYLEPVTAVIDEQLISYIDELAPEYYNEKWNFNLNQ
ncbi:MAG: carboxypeptidase-like regulatory domain-containing protein [Euryarchaeota archaeon]|nr:carboxypeptidase-like regulatory domain-containing protein [Euryarchaeota archaeon]